MLVLVAAGLAMTVLHTAHEAGWINVGQGTAVDLTWLVRPGTVLASLLTGVLGLQPKPTVVEVDRLAALRRTDARLRRLAARRQADADRHRPSDQPCRRPNRPRA